MLTIAALIKSLARAPLSILSSYKSLRENDIDTVPASVYVYHRRTGNFFAKGGGEHLPKNSRKLPKFL